MINTIYYSPKIKTIIVIPKMGSGVKIERYCVSTLPVLFLQRELDNDKSYKVVKVVKIE